MKNYFDKYLKYKLKYLKLKNQNGAGVNDDLFEKYKTLFENNGISKDNIASIDTKILRDNIKSLVFIEENKNLFNQYNILINGINIPASKIFQDKLKSIKIIEENKELFEYYNIYKSGNEIPYWNILLDNLNSIKLIEENKDYFKKYGIYKNGDIIPSENDLIDKMTMIRQFQLLIKYGIYKDDDDENLFRIDIVEPLLKKYKRELSIIKLLENDTILIDNIDNKVKIYNQYKIKIYNQYKDDLPELENFLNYKTIQIPKTFYISGLLRFAVYKNEKLNKIIYLLGERHNLKDLCGFVEDDEIKTEKLIQHYNADDFFYSLLNSGIKNKNKLDVFLEMTYNPVDKAKKFYSKIPKFKSSGYMAEVLKKIYNDACKPNYIKKLYGEHNLCIYDGFVRFHHTDLRDSGDKFVEYIDKLWWRRLNPDNEEEFTMKYSDYDKEKILKLMQLSSIFLQKIKKQTDNIIIDDIKKVFEERRIDFIKLCLNNIRNDLLSFKYIKSESPWGEKGWGDVVDKIFIQIMDLYLMGRVFRSFYDYNSNEIYNSKNIIIYAGDVHIENYIKILKDLNFEEKYHYTNSAKNKEACLKVDNFNIDYFS